MNKYKEQFEKYINSYNFNSVLSDAIKYVMLGSGNRIRPQLVLAWCDVCGGNVEAALPLALAIECCHTMSLIHDDLPCMDNEKIRRGKACLHLHTSEAVAVLTGDMLLSTAFYIIANSVLDDKQKLEAIKAITYATRCMGDGQYSEICANTHSIESWHSIHYGKTAVLLETACILGVIAANGSQDTILEAAEYGKSIGMAYQLLDDKRDHDGISIITDPALLQNMINEYKSHCYIGETTEPRMFLSQLAKKVLI